MGAEKEYMGSVPTDSHDVESPYPEGQTEFSLAGEGAQLERGLKSRHIQFLALGKSCARSPRPRFLPAATVG